MPAGRPWLDDQAASYFVLYVCLHWVWCFVHAVRSCSSGLFSYFPVYVLYHLQGGSIDVFLLLPTLPFYFFLSGLDPAVRLLCVGALFGSEGHGLQLMMPEGI